VTNLRDWALDGTAPETWDERWAPIPGAPAHYEVSDRGQIRSSYGAYRLGYDGNPKVLAPAPNDCGYLKVSLGRSMQVYVHRAVLTSFVGPAPDDGEVWTVDHIDYDLRNNRLSNLRYLTIEENSARHSPEDLEAWWGKQHHRRVKIRL
jgi:hypothetical protein